MTNYERELNSIVDDIFDLGYHNGMSDVQIAEKADLNINTVLRLASRTTKLPRFLTVQKLAKAVGAVVALTKPKLKLKKVG